MKRLICFILILLLTRATSSYADVLDDRIHFINVGDGDCILIEDNKNYVLIDGGEDIYSSQVLDYLEERGIDHINTIIFTHTHKDHTDGLYSILNTEDIQVDNVIGVKLPPPSLVREKPEDYIKHKLSYDLMVSSIYNRSLDIKYPVENEILEVGDSATLRFINTNVEKPYNKKLNDMSLCIEYVNGRDKILLTSDIISATEKRILAKLGEVDVIKVPHHGYFGSSSSELLDKTKPKLAILSSEKSNNEIVNMTYNNKNIPVISTYKYGNIELISSGKGVLCNFKIDNN